jgi:hypothetical protein
MDVILGNSLGIIIQLGWRDETSNPVKLFIPTYAILVT